MLLALRRKLADGDSKWNVTRVDIKEKAIYTAWSWMIRDRRVYDFFAWLAAAGQKIFPQRAGMIRKLPPPLHGWTTSRDMKPLASRGFKQRWESICKC
jgi:L-lactate dehydrogenase complex protein LldF